MAWVAPLILVGVGLWYLLERRNDAAAADAGGDSLDLVGQGERLLAQLGRSVSGGWTAPAAADPYVEAIAQAEAAYGIPHGLWLRQLDIESDHFAPDVVNGARLSSAGAIGIAQLEPATAGDLGVDPRDPFASIDAGARYMRSLYDRFGTWAAALIAYNWGQGNVARKGTDAAPTVSKQYASMILSVVPGVT